VSDVNIGSAVEWDHAAAAGARIAAGAHEGLTVLTSLVDERGDTLVEHLEKTVPAGASVVVTGHSLGGCLASVLAMHLNHVAGGKFKVRPITFAAPTAGDLRFAERYELVRCGRTRDEPQLHRSVRKEPGVGREHRVGRRVGPAARSRGSATRSQVAASPSPSRATGRFAPRATAESWPG
jgi:pimeloyl-ACP methyl ester carboxylesterase